MGDKSNVPPRILILLDRLANTELHSLTKRRLKEHVDELKAALNTEFQRVKLNPERPAISSSQAPVKSAADSSVPTAKSSNSARKPVTNDQKRTQSSSNKGDDKRREDTRGKQSRPAAAPPKFEDLLKIAGNPRRDSPPSQPPSRGGSREKVIPEKRSRIENGHRNDPSLDRSKGSVRQPSASASSSFKRTSVESGRREASSNSSKVDNRVQSRNPSHDSKSLPRNERREERSGKDRQSPSSRPAEKAKNGREPPPPPKSKDQTSSKGKETKKPKIDEKNLLEKRKQQIREENERVRIRNEVLAGKRSASELKNVVKSVSHGSTVLSCGAPPDRRDDPSYGRPRRPPDERSRDQGRGYDRMPPSGTRRPNYRYENYDDDDDEDEEMDDFIDDEEEIEDANPDVSKHIRDIFGYDKRKYAGMDDDVEEASYGQILKEEARSQRLGKLEDLEDMKEEMRQKKLKQERLKRANR